MTLRLEYSDTEEFLKDVQREKLIGKGAYGAVYKANHVPTGTNIALKCLQLVEQELDELMIEISILRECNCTHIVQFYGNFLEEDKEGDKMWIMMEFCGLGSAKDIMDVLNASFTEHEISFIVKHALLGLDYLHQNYKIHRDIKADNILLTETGQPKLADFGVSGNLQGTLAKRKTMIGTPYFLAPEVIQNDEAGYDVKVDIWSLGITAIELAETIPPYWDDPPFRVLFQIPSNPPPTLANPELFSDLFKDFIASCLVKSPSKRPTAAQMMKHPFVTQDLPSNVMQEVLDQLVKDKPKSPDTSPVQSQTPSQTPSQPQPTQSQQNGKTIRNKTQGKLPHQEKPQPIAVSSPKKDEDQSLMAKIEDKFEILDGKVTLRTKRRAEEAKKTPIPAALSKSALTPPQRPPPAVPTKSVHPPIPKRTVEPKSPVPPAASKPDAVKFTKSPSHSPIKPAASSPVPFPLKSSASSPALNSGSPQPRDALRHVSYLPGESVWQPHPQHVWIPGKVLSVKGNDVIVVDSEGHESTHKLQSVLRLHESSLKHVADMVSLAELSEASLLHNIRTRYNKNIVYTFIGSILVSVNPYKSIPLYSSAQIELYRGNNITTTPPHIYGIGEKAFYNMSSSGKKQAIIVGGESGSGKTEATKILLQYLSVVGASDTQTKGSKVEQQIIEANTILEAFGNAKTVRNNNSSRFGKFIQVMFDSKNHINGALVINYLLEKSRVVFQAPTERNYHCFYQLCEGVTDAQRKTLFLKPASEFHYLYRSGCFKIEGVDDKKELEHLQQAMKMFGITEEQICAVMQVLSAILHLGNIQFASGKDSKAKVVEGPSLDAAAALLGCKKSQLEVGLRERTLAARNNKSVYTISLNVDQANDSRDALSKALYSLLFDWLVDKINSEMKCNTPNRAYIGILDIFGFECFDLNSFEQLCINYTNEKLQKFFNDFIFKMEKIEYSKEGIEIQDFGYTDNEQCVNLLDAKPIGIFHLLDEKCLFPQSTDLTFVEKVKQTHDKHPNFLSKRMHKNPTEFTVAHFAGEVTYDAKGFLEKNKDVIHPDLSSLISNTSFEFVKELWNSTSVTEHSVKKSSSPVSLRGNTASKRIITVGGKFRDQLSALLDALSYTEPKFVRCFKPNAEKLPNSFNSHLILSQLRYCGLLEAVTIRKCGFSVRRSFVEFYQRFKILLPKENSDGLNSQTELQQCEAICNYLASQSVLNTTNIRFGKTKIFLKENQYDTLERQRESQLHSVARSIQRVYRGKLCRCRFRDMKHASLLIQSVIRMLHAQRLLSRSKSERERLLEEQESASMRREELYLLSVYAEEKKLREELKLREEKEERERRALRQQSEESFKLYRSRSLSSEAPSDTERSERDKHRKREKRDKSAKRHDKKEKKRKKEKKDGEERRHRHKRKESLDFEIRRPKLNLKESSSSSSDDSEDESQDSWIPMLNRRESISDTSRALLSPRVIDRRESSFEEKRSPSEMTPEERQRHLKAILAEQQQIIELEKKRSMQGLLGNTTSKEQAKKTQEELDKLAKWREEQKKNQEGAAPTKAEEEKNKKLQEERERLKKLREQHEKQRVSLELPKPPEKKQDPFYMFQKTNSVSTMDVNKLEKELERRKRIAGKLGNNLKGWNLWAESNTGGNQNSK